jgi:hypothetical protein
MEVSVPDVVINWKDGLPDDPVERAQIEQILVGSDLTSRYSAIKRLRDGDDEDAREELERIAQEEGLEAARAAAFAAGGRTPEEESEKPEPMGASRSSRQVMARMKQERGQNPDQAGRDPRKGPKLGG